MADRGAPRSCAIPCDRRFRGPSATGRCWRRSRDGASLILIPDWSIASAINDKGFSEGAADAFFASLIELDRKLSENTGRSVLGSSLHFIGHQRGAVVNTEILQRLMTAQGLGTLGRIDVTTLDPPALSQPQYKAELSDVAKNLGSLAGTVAKVLRTFEALQYAAGGLLTASGVGTAALPALAAANRYTVAAAKAVESFQKVVEAAGSVMDALDIGTLDYTTFQDPLVTNWDGVAFAANYFQTATDTGGGDGGKSSFSSLGAALATSDVNIDLKGRPGFFEDDDVLGYGVNTLSERTVAWYMGTIDPNAESFPMNRDTERFFRSAADRFAQTNNSFLLRQGKIARYYNEPREARVATLLFGGGAYDTSRRSAWYAARNEENPDDFAPTDTEGWQDAIWEGVGTGWYYTASGGGTDRAATLPKADRSGAAPGTDNRHPDDKEDRPAIPDIFNGDFESTFRPFLGRVPVPLQSFWEVGGWSLQGGGIITDTSDMTGVPEVSAFATSFMSLPFAPGSGLGWEIDVDGLAALARQAASDAFDATVEEISEFIGVIVTAVLDPEALADVFDSDKDVFTNVTAFFDWLKQRQDPLGNIDAAINETYREPLKALHEIMSLFQPDKQGRLQIVLNDDTDISTALDLFKKLLPSKTDVIQFLQEHLLDYHFVLDAGHALMHNTMYFPDADAEMVSLDLAWNAVSTNRLRVFIEQDGRMHELATPTPDAVLAVKDGFTSLSPLPPSTIRVGFDIPAALQGKVGRLIVMNDAGEGGGAKMLVDNISFDAGYIIEDSYRNRSDLRILFNDAGEKTPDPDNLMAPFLTASSTVNGQDRHELTFRNTMSRPIDIRVAVPAGLFLSIEDEGGWTYEGDDSGGRFNDGDARGSYSLSLVPGGEATLILRAAVDPDWLADNRGNAAMLLSSLLTIEVDQILEGDDRRTTTHEAELFYVLDMGDDSSTDGIFRVRGTVVGQERAFEIVQRGDLADDDRLKLLMPEEATWFEVDDSTLTVSPSGDIGTVSFFGGVEDGLKLRDIQNARLTFEWDGAALGEVELEALGTAPRRFGLDKPQLVEKLREQLVLLRLAEQAVGQEINGRDSQAFQRILFTDRLDDLVEQMEREVRAALDTGFGLTNVGLGRSLQLSQDHEESPAIDYLTRPYLVARPEVPGPDGKWRLVSEWVTINRGKELKIKETTETVTRVFDLVSLTPRDVPVTVEPQREEFEINWRTTEVELLRIPGEIIRIAGTPGRFETTSRLVEEAGYKIDGYLTASKASRDRAQEVLEKFGDILAPLLSGLAPGDQQDKDLIAALGTDVVSIFETLQRISGRTDVLLTPGDGSTSVFDKTMRKLGTGTTASASADISFEFLLDSPITDEDEGKALAMRDSFKGLKSGLEGEVSSLESRIEAFLSGPLGAGIDPATRDALLRELAALSGESGALTEGLDLAGSEIVGLFGALRGKGALLAATLEDVVAEADTVLGQLATLRGALEGARVSGAGWHAGVLAANTGERGAAVETSRAALDSQVSALIAAEDSVRTSLTELRAALSAAATAADGDLAALEPLAERLSADVAALAALGAEFTAFNPLDLASGEEEAWADFASQLRGLLPADLLAEMQDGAGFFDRTGLDAVAEALTDEALPTTVAAAQRSLEAFNSELSALPDLFESLAALADAAEAVGRGDAGTTLAAELIAEARSRFRRASSATGEGRAAVFLLRRSSMADARARPSTSTASPPRARWWPHHQNRFDAIEDKLRRAVRRGPGRRAGVALLWKLLDGEADNWGRSIREYPGGGAAAPTELVLLQASNELDP